MSAATDAERTKIEEDVSQTEESRPLDASAVEWIRAHPWASLLGAAALGFLVARLSRSER
jgi:hypothetical protein